MKRISDHHGAVTILIFLCRANRCSSEAFELRGACLVGAYGGTGFPGRPESSTVIVRRLCRKGVATNSQQGGIMPNYIHHDTAARFRERAAECVRLAAASIDADVEAQYRTLAEQYVKLADGAGSLR